MEQFPTAFEFNEHFLITILDHLYRFGREEREMGEGWNKIMVLSDLSIIMYLYGKEREREREGEKERFYGIGETVE